MKTPLVWKIVIVINLLLLSELPGASVRAQGEAAVHISAPEVDAFPEITVYIDPTARDGSPQQGLSAEQIALTEDGIPRELLDFQELQPGIQLVVAFNISNPFAIQDINGRSRFEFIVESLLNWAAQPLDTSPDDLSIVTNTGLEAVHLTSREEWRKVLEDFTPDPREVESNFNVLARAIEIASDPVVQPGMKRVVLLFSAQAVSDSFSAIDSLISQAQDNQVLVYSVLVSSPAFFETEGALKLQSLSQETGGVFLPFSGDEPLADLGQLFQPLRSTYLLRYQSSIVTGGTHTLEVTIRSAPADTTGLREFYLDVQPPNPILISPPRSITRTAQAASPEETENLTFLPTSITLPLLVEFPDSHPRGLEELIFRVDGEIVEVKTDPPYDQVVWDLDGYQTSGIHYLTLEAVDIMGLSRMSVPTSIEIVVDQPPQKISGIIKRNAPSFAGLGLILLLGMTLFILIARGSIQPGRVDSTSWIITQGRRTAGHIRRILTNDSSSVQGMTISGANRYRLTAINDVSQQLFTEPITVNEREIILGNRPGDGVIQIQHPSIIAEHTRITAREDDRYQIFDLGGVGGTWVNYQQLTSSQVHFLKDGDIIHIGEAAFRFQTFPKIQGPLQNEENHL